MRGGIQSVPLAHIFDSQYLDGTPFHWLQTDFETVPSAAASATQACSSGTDRQLDAAAVFGGTEDAGDGCSSTAISSSLNATDRKSWFMKGLFHGGRIRKTRHFSGDVALIAAAFHTGSVRRFGDLGDSTDPGRGEPARYSEPAGSVADAGDR